MEKALRPELNLSKARICLCEFVTLLETYLRGSPTIKLQIGCTGQHAGTMHYRDV
jgi:hypothetical protein